MLEYPTNLEGGQSVNGTGPGPQACKLLPLHASLSFAISMLCFVGLVTCIDSSPPGKGSENCGKSCCYLN